MQGALSPAERESLDRVMAALDVERETSTGSPLAALWLDWADALADLRGGEAVA